jgi:hypothetical protein
VPGSAGVRQAEFGGERAAQLVGGSGVAGQPVDVFTGSDRAAQLHG